MDIFDHLTPQERQRAIAACDAILASCKRLEEIGAELDRDNAKLRALSPAKAEDVR